MTDSVIKRHAATLRMFPKYYSRLQMSVTEKEIFNAEDAE
jgi:hypothetical protein